MKKTRVLFVLENYFPHIGGVETFFKILCEGLVKKGFDVDVVTHRMKNTPIFEKIGGVNIYRVSSFHSRYFFTILSLPKIFSLAKKADIIHTTTFTAAPPASICGLLRKKPVIITVHEVWIGRWKKLTEMNPIMAFIHDLLERIIYLFRYDQYICVSNSTAKMLKEQINVKNIDVIHSGVDYDHFNPKKYKQKSILIRKDMGLQDKFVYMTYGRPGVSKGFEFIIQAVPYIKKEVKNSKLILIMSKDKAIMHRHNMMLELIKKLKIEDDVIVLSPRPWNELPAYIMSADCIVVPSIAEGFGLTTIEPTTLGLPVVASNTTSIPEVISGEHVLVEPANPKSIAKGVIQVYRGKADKTKQKIFRWEKNIDSYISLYGRILKKRR